MVIKGTVPLVPKQNAIRVGRMEQNGGKQSASRLCFIEHLVSPKFGVDVNRRIACLSGIRTKAIQPVASPIIGLAIRK
jgi:hypothetical protein